METARATHPRRAPSGALLIILACAAWSFAGVLSKWAPWSALSIIGARALVTTLVFGLSRKSFRPSLSRGNLLGALGVLLTSALFIIANKLTSAANAIVLQYAMPVVVILIYWVVYKQRPGWLDVGAALLVLGGVALCFMGGLGRGGLLGDTLALLSAFTFALVFFSARLKDADPMDYTYLGSLLASLFLLYLPFDRQFTLAPQALLAVGLMGLCLTAGYLLFTAGMRKRVHPVTAAIVANVEPVLNPIWAFLFIGEHPGTWSILGAALVILGVSTYSVLKNRQERRGAAASPA
ncbi:MAG: EamA family transporter [Clostridiales bacterium]|nr:EamA family transporter [Clostridiales bacterium]